ncbi:MAG: flavodoxin [Acidobacteria bacterium]|nr:flavodoxin [Acidobacteriota bacterium]
MRAVVIYESMFGNTRRIARAIVEGLADAMEVHLIRADEVSGPDLEGASLVVVGAPTHAWGLPRANTREGAMATSRKPDNDLVLEPAAATSPGVREWLPSLGGIGIAGAAFDTRFRAPGMFTGHASKVIARSLRHEGVDVVLAPESFFVDRHNHMVAGEEARARAWGRRLAAEVATRAKG